MPKILKKSTQKEKREREKIAQSRSSNCCRGDCDKLGLS